MYMLPCNMCMDFGGQHPSSLILDEKIFSVKYLSNKILKYLNLL